MVDQAGAIPMWVPEAITFDSTDATWVVLHKTGGFSTPEECATYFINGSDGRNVSAHYVVGLDGKIVQCVPESRGAGANCCTEAGHASYLPQGVNLNIKSISIEHIDPSTDNSTPMPPAQVAASIQLIHGICTRHNIPMRRGDAAGGIIGHNDIAPINRARCPGPTYPWDTVLANLQEGHMSGVPSGWHDDGHNLTGPNGEGPVTMGFRENILGRDWDPGNVPTGKEYNVPQVLLHAPELGGGDIQIYRDGMHWWTQKKGVVYEPYLGWEIAACYKRIGELQAALDSIKNTPPPSPTPDVKSTVQTAIQELSKLL